jgi:hypothetical protein
MAKSPEKPRKPRKESSGRANWGRRILTILIALAAVGGFAMIVVYSYDLGNETENDENTPLIEAQTGPTKVRPADPGGMIIPNQDKQVYDRLDKDSTKNRVETLLPAPEPIIAKPPPVMTTMAPPALDKMPSPPPVPEMAQKAPEIMTPPPPPPPPVLTLRPEPKTVVAPKPASVPEPVNILPPVKPAKVTPVKKGWRVQFASLRSEKDAKTAWSRLAKRNVALMQGLEPHVVRADLKKRGIYYRLQAGPLANRAAAAAFCKRAKARKIGCIIVRP